MLCNETLFTRLCMYFKTGLFFLILFNEIISNLNIKYDYPEKLEI